MSSLERIKNHSVTRNAAALGIMQISNYAVPLLLLPFLTHQLGADTFGVVAITLAVIQLSFVLTDYGFTLSATYSISINRNSTTFINNKIGAVFGAKIILVSTAITLLLAIPNIFSKLSQYSAFFTAASIATIAQAFQPIWLFQGIERMKYITIYTVITKILYAALVLMFVRNPSDAILVIYYWGLSQTLGLFTSLYLMKMEGYSISLPTLKSVKGEFLEGAQYFWSRLAVAIYTSASTLVVGTNSTTQAAHFAVCEQIYKAGQNVTSPINNAMFPYMAKNKDWSVFYKILAGTAAILFIGCATLSIFSEQILILLFGIEYAAATSTLMIFLCITVVNYFTVTFGYSAFAALGNISTANTSVIAGSLVHAIILFALYSSDMVNATNVALAILFTESLVLCIRLYTFNKIKSTLYRLNK